MRRWLEKLIVRLWNGRAARGRAVARTAALDLGMRLIDGNAASGRVGIPQNRRAEHIVTIGKTGTGKSSLIKSCATQDIRRSGSGGFVYFDLHGDATPFLVATIADQERALRKDLSQRLIVIEPADRETSVGFNFLEEQGDADPFIQVAEFAEVLKQRWHLESLGARTDELLRNALYVLAENNLTLLELAPLLSHAAFRAACLKNVINPEIAQYFELRYDQASEPMRATMREPILNKTSAFTANRQFRHIVGQHSTFSVLDALDHAWWIILDVPKGRLGEQAITLASLFFTIVKNALFARKSRELFTLYCDEMQNLVSYANGIDTVLSESRKFAISFVGGTQFLDQLPPDMRSAVLAVGTNIFFQLASSDAQQVAAALDGGKPLAELMKNLPPRHIVVKTGHERWQEAIVSTLHEPRTDPSDLLARSRARWARNRNDIENEIHERQKSFAPSKKEALDAWE